MLKTVEDTTGNGIVFLIQNSRSENVFSRRVVMNDIEWPETSLHGIKKLASGSTESGSHLMNGLKTRQKSPNGVSQNKFINSYSTHAETIEMDKLLKKTVEQPEVNCAEFHILLKSNKAEIKLKGSSAGSCRSTEDNMDAPSSFSAEDTDNRGQEDVNNNTSCIQQDKKLSKELKKCSQKSLTPVVQECWLREHHSCDTVIFLEHQGKEQLQCESKITINTKDTEDVSSEMGCTQVSVRNDFENYDFGENDSFDYRPRTPQDLVTEFEKVDKLCDDHNNNADNTRNQSNYSSGCSIELKDLIMDFGEEFDCPLRDQKARDFTEQDFDEHGLKTFQCDNLGVECDSSWEPNSFDSTILPDAEIHMGLSQLDTTDVSENINDTKLVDCFYTPNCETPKMYKYHTEFTPKREELPRPCVTEEVEVNLLDDRTANGSSSYSAKSDQDKTYNYETENDSSSSFETRKRNIDLSLQWIRNELEEIDLLDLQLVNQFSSMLSDIELMKEDAKAFEEYLLEHRNVDAGQAEYPLDLDELDGMEQFCNPSCVHQGDSACASDIEAVCSEISTFYALSKVSPPGKLKCFVLETI